MSSSECKYMLFVSPYILNNSFNPFQTNNALRRTIEYAVSLGGDTDTIASMAAALVGSYYGEEVIPQYYLKHTEAGKELAHLGEKLYDLVAPDLPPK